MARSSLYLTNRKTDKLGVSTWFNSTSHSPQPLGWGPGHVQGYVGVLFHRNHFNGFEVFLANGTNFTEVGVKPLKWLPSLQRAWLIEATPDPKLKLGENEKLSSARNPGEVERRLSKSDTSDTVSHS